MEKKKSEKKIAWRRGARTEVQQFAKKLVEMEDKDDSKKQQQKKSKIGVYNRVREIFECFDMKKSISP